MVPNSFVQTLMRQFNHSLELIDNNAQCRIWQAEKISTSFRYLQVRAKKCVISILIN